MRLQVRHASESLRAMLSEDAEGKKKVMALPTLQAPTMRFSRRQRGMEIDQDLAAKEELVMQEAHVTQHRRGPAPPQTLMSHVFLMPAQGHHEKA